MSLEKDQLLAGIAALEAQRDLLGDAVVENALAGLRAKLSALSVATPAAEQSLRQVTILFLDVVGSTALSQDLDPEEINAVMDGALVGFTATVEAHGGKVLNYAGDNLLAIFGADEVREDDAERGVRCGLALLSEGRTLGEEVRRRHGHEEFNVRVGLHTSNVLLGGGVDGEGSIRGVGVNIAARMEQTAPAGGLRISHDTYTHVRGLFDVEPQPPIAVKGIDEPMTTYLVSRERPRAFRVASHGIEGVQARFIGRDRELGALQGAFKRLVADRRFALVAVIAEAGMGKSRLLDEFATWAESRPETFHSFQGRATPQTQGQPYGLLRDLVAAWLHIGDGDSVAVARRKIEAGIARLFATDDGADLAESHAHLLGHLVGVDFSDSHHIAGIKDDSRQIRDRAFHAVARVFRRLASAEQHDRPIVVYLEDLHWADEGTLDLLSYLADVNADVPMLVLALTRPTLLDRRSGFGTCIHQRVELGPLDAGSSRLLAGELLKRLPEEHSELAELLAGRAEGNPFYMEELMKMLVGQGAIGISGETWTFRPDQLQATQVPTTLTGVLQARLDALPRAERRALQEASVIGLVFWDRALAALNEHAPDLLPALVRRQLALPRQGAALEEVREYAFSHQILHQVTYGTLLKRTRRALHALVAGWLAGVTGVRANDFLGDIAEHYALAGDPVNAAAFFVRAAEHAQSRFAHETALAHAARALAMLEQPEFGGHGTRDALMLRWQALLVREYTLAQKGERVEQRTALEALQNAADALDDDRLRALALRRRSILALRTADPRAQESAARQAMALAERAGDVASKLEAQRLLADALGALGDYAAGKSLAHGGLTEARARGLRRVEGTFLNALSFIAGRQDDQVAGLQFDLQDLPIWRELGDRHGEAVALGNVGADWLWFGQLAQARPLLEEALESARAIGARDMECAPLGNLSQLALWEGDAEQSLALGRAGLKVATAIQANEFEAQILIRVGEAELALGQLAAAAQSFAQAEALGRQLGIGVEHDALAGRARVALAQVDVAGAMAFAQALLARREIGSGLEGADLKLLLFTCYGVFARAGDPRAPALLAEANEALCRIAETISDPVLRASFLDQVPGHRAIRAAWAGSQAGA